MATEQMFTSLPTVSTANMSDIICAVQGYVSSSNPGLSVQETLQQVYNLFQSNLILFNAGNPNGAVAGTTYQLCWDTTDKILYVCTTSGTSSTAVWSPAIPVITTPTASTYASWDANANLSANNFNAGYATTATAVGTTTLTVASASQQYFTGTTTQTLVMPVVSTCALGQSWLVVNNSTGAVTVQSSGLNTITTLAGGTSARFTVISLTGATASSWNSSYNEGELVIPVTVPQGGTGNTSATAYSLITGGTTSSGAFQFVASSTSGYPLVYKGTSALPAYSSTPIITQILDTNSNELAGFTTTATAVNYVNFTNNSTGNAPIIAAAGSDTNITLQVKGQGTGGAAIHGTGTNDSAAAGYMGEFIDSGVVGPTNVTPSANNINLTSISLTAGDWDVMAQLYFVPANATTNGLIGGISITSATLPTTGSSGYFASFSPGGATGIGNVSHSATLRLSLSGTTTVYLVVQASWTTNTPTATGQLTARRRR